MTLLDLAPYADAIRWVAILAAAILGLGGLALMRRRLRNDAVAAERQAQAEAREQLHDEAERHLDAPPPTGAMEILERRAARRRRHYRDPRE